ncbi:MAG: hypothetical protein ACTSUE_06955 [Promethearchaeota archaeon]
MPETRLRKLRPAYGKSRSVNTIRRDLFISKEVRENIEKAIPKMKYITPTELSSKFGIKISSAKEFLREMEKKHVVKQYEHVKSNRLLVFVPVD